MPRNDATAPGESYGREPAGWGERVVGAARDDAPVDMRNSNGSIRPNGWVHADSICRTAVYVTRTHGGVGGRGREASSYPD